MRTLILLATLITGALSLAESAHADHKWVDVRLSTPGLRLQLVHDDRPLVIVEHTYAVPRHPVDHEYDVEYDDWKYVEDYDDDSDSDSDYYDDSDSDSDSDDRKDRRGYRRR